MMSNLKVSNHCNEGRITPPESIFNYVITLAIILSYFPQYQRIITRNSSQGISPVYILLGTIFTTSALANTLLLKSANGSYDCCKIGSLHGSECFTALAATSQVALQFVGSVVLFVIYLIFYPRPSIDLPPHKHPKRHSLSKSDLALSPERRRALSSRPFPRLPKLIAFSTTLLAFMILVPTLSIAFSPDLTSYAPASLIQDWSFFTATLSLLVATVQFLPQLFTTIRLKHHASLSLVMLAVQSIVYILLGASKAMNADKAPHDEGRRSWTRYLQNGELEWMGYVVSGATEALVLVVGVYLVYMRAKRVGGMLVGDMDGDDVFTTVEGDEEEEYITSVSLGEETPLLPGRRGESEFRGSNRWGREAMGR